MAQGDTYSPIQIARAAYNAGWRGLDLIRAVAIALAESGGKSIASPPNSNGTIDRGVWQINSSHADVPDVVAYDLNQSAQAAFALYRRNNGFGDWAAYNQGTWKEHIAEAMSAAGNLPADAFAGVDKAALDSLLSQQFTSGRDAIGGAVGGAVGGLPGLSGIDAVGDFFNNLRKPETLFKAGITVLAGFLIIGGLGLYVFGPSSLDPRDVGKTVIKDAAMAAKGTAL